MDNHPGTFSNIDEYIHLFPPAIQTRLEELRRVIRLAAPEATEKISYQMPTFFFNGNLIHFAVHTHHIGLYPGSSGIARFSPEFGSRVFSKGAVQFPLDEDMPWDLIRRMTEFRRNENLQLKRKK